MPYPVAAIRGIYWLYNLAAPYFVNGEVGNINATSVVVSFNEEMKSTNFSNGVTITNVTSGSIISTGSAVLELDKHIVTYTVAPAVSIGNAITWEYLASAGDISDLAGNLLLNTIPQTIINHLSGFSPGDAMGVLGLTYGGGTSKAGYSMGCLGLTYSS
jgi:hypothetical protein